MPSNIEATRIFSKLPFGASLSRNGYGAVSFQGNEFYSYAACIARKTGPKTAEVTTKKYSQTTTKHTNQIVGALISDGWEIVRKDF